MPVQEGDTPLGEVTASLSAMCLADGRLNSANAAAYLGVSRKTMALWRHQRDGPDFYKLGGRIFYFRRDLDAWICSQRRSRVIYKGAGNGTNDA